jgi:hypothetical protein
MAISAGVEAESSAIEAGDPPATAGGRSWRRYWIAGGVVVAAIGLFFAYLRMAWNHPINADGATNMLQASDLVHGNPLMSGWTLSDVSFYTTELIQYALLQLLFGIGPGTIHIAAAMTYTLLLLVVAWFAKGHTVGWEAVARVGVAVCVMLVPAPGIGYMTLLSSPNHTGSGVPMILTWLVLDRFMARRWTPVVVAVMLAWGEIADPLVTFVGAVPLMLMAAWHVVFTKRPWRQRLWNTDARLVLAGLGSVVLAHGFLYAVRANGGFIAPAPPVALAQPEELPGRVRMVTHMLGAIFGLHRPGETLGPAALAMDLFHIFGVLLVVVALILTLVRGVRRRPSTEDAQDGATDRVNLVLVLAILVNLGAELVSTLPIDILATREVVAVLPLGAALAGRVCGPRLRGWKLRPVLAGFLVLLLGSLIVYSPARTEPAENQDIAEWLDANHMTYGLASYWNANNITIATNKRVTVVPVAGGDPVAPYCWQSRDDWYDRTKHTATFVIFNKERPLYGTQEAAIKQFGVPVRTHDFGREIVLVYEDNLLDKLPKPCS